MQHNQQQLNNYLNIQFFLGVNIDKRVLPKRLKSRITHPQNSFELQPKVEQK